MKAIIAIVSKKGEGTAEAAIAMLKTLENKNIESYGIASPTTIKWAKTIEELPRQNLESPVIIGQAFSRVFPIDRLQTIALSGATLVFEGRLYPTVPKASDAEAIIGKFDRKEWVEQLFKSDGFFAFAIAKPDKIIAGRDVMGVYPLCYGENSAFAALSSERKALWKIGIKNANSFPPGHVVLIDKRGFHFKHVRTLTYSKSKQITMESAAESLQKLLRHSVKETVYGLREVAIAFSGGLDSSLIAFLAKATGVNVHLIHVSLKNQSETEHVKRVAEELKLPVHVYLYDEECVQKVLQRVLWIIEEPDAVKASIGVPFYWTAEKAAQIGLTVLLAGQGADELFGGYKRYVDDYLRFGGEKTHKILFDDVVKMHETNFERDFKICNFHNVELRLPFANFQIARFAVNLPVTLKLVLPDDGLRKLVLRRVAENLGLPKFIVERPKKAIQYATGVNKVLKKQANKEGLSLREYLCQTFQTLRKQMMEDE